MNTKRLAVAGLATAAVATAVPFALAAPASASADIEKHGSCAGARYDFDVDRERGGFEVSFEVDSNTPNQKWRLVLFQNGDRVFRDVRTTDGEGEVDFERLRPNTPGADTFRAKAVKLSNGQSCSVRITH